MPFTALQRKLRATPDFTAEEINAVGQLPVIIRHYGANADILRERDRPSQSCMIIQGFLCRFKVIEQGKRQIMSFHMAGDIPDLQSLHLAVADHNLGTLSKATVAFIPHHSIQRIVELHPRIGAFFWRETLIDAAIFREWIVNVGRREAYGRMAHLICEQVVRLRAAGLEDESGLPWFLTQTVIADATGLSTVHVNRVIQKLRRKGLIVNGRDRFKVPDWDALVIAAGFEQTYLHWR